MLRASRINLKVKLMDLSVGRSTVKKMNGRQLSNMKSHACWCGPVSSGCVHQYLPRSFCFPPSRLAMANSVEAI